MNYRTQLINSTSRMLRAPDEPAVEAAPAPAEGETPPAEGEDPASTQPAGDADDGIDLTKNDGTVLDPKKDEPKAKDEPAPVAPEAYEFKLPDDRQVDPALVEAATPIFKELNLTQEQAQKVVDLYDAQVLPGVAQTVQAETLRLLGLQDIGKWTDQVKADKEIGGAHLEETLTLAAKGRDTFASKELVELLHTSRLGNHPEVVRFFAKVGKTIGEDTVHNGTGGEAAPTSAAAVLYAPEFGPRS